MDEYRLRDLYRQELLSLWKQCSILYEFAEAACGLLSLQELLPTVRDFVKDSLDLESVLVACWPSDKETWVCGPRGIRTSGTRPNSPNLPYDGKAHILTNAIEMATDRFLREEGVEGMSALSLPLRVGWGQEREVIGVLVLAGWQQNGEGWLENEALLLHLADIITLAVKTAAAQAEKQAALLRLAAGVAHEVKNRLAIISGEAQYVLSKAQPGTPLRESAEAIKRNMDRADMMVKNLLAYAREEESRFAPVSINRLVEDSLQTVATQAAVQEIVTATELASGLPEVMVDREQMERVFLNILLNACEAMPKGGRLTVTTALSDDKNLVHVAFRDTGVGVPPEALSQVFDPFFTTKSKGTGLGLAVCKDLVEKHRGKIKVESEPGQGATFIVSLPVERKTDER